MTTGRSPEPVLPAADDVPTPPAGLSLPTPAPEPPVSSPGGALADALVALREATAVIRFELDIPGAQGARESGAELVKQLDDYVLPRLRRLDAPLLTVVGGSVRYNFRDGTADDETVGGLRREIRAQIAHDAGHLLRGGPPDRAAATSKTFRSLARICGAAPSGDGALVPRSLPCADLSEWIPKLVAMTPEALADLPGVSPSRAHQIVPGALVAEACMDIFDLTELEICPWALREGVIFRRLDTLDGRVRPAPAHDGPVPALRRTAATG